MHIRFGTLLLSFLITAAVSLAALNGVSNAGKVVSVFVPFVPVQSTFVNSSQTRNVTAFDTVPLKSALPSKYKRPSVALSNNAFVADTAPTRLHDAPLSIEKCH